MKKKLPGYNKKKILVIGGTGFIGFHVIKEAKKRKLSVHSISLHSPKPYRHHKGVKYIHLDISNFQRFSHRPKHNIPLLPYLGPTTNKKLKLGCCVAARGSA